MPLNVVTELEPYSQEQYDKLASLLGPSMTVPSDLSAFEPEDAIQIVMLTSGATRRQAVEMLALRALKTTDAGRPARSEKIDFPLPSGIATQQAVDAIKPTQ